MAGKLKMLCAVPESEESGGDLDNDLDLFFFFRCLLTYSCSDSDCKTQIATLLAYTTLSSKLTIKLHTKVIVYLDIRTYNLLIQTPIFYVF